MSKTNQESDTYTKLAVLIDGDNAESSLVEQFLTEAARYGKVTVKRVYGDWTTPSMKSWKDKLNYCAVRPIQKFEYTTGKGSTDTALIIDAMDLLHSRHVTGFCVVSSDSDYTGLAHRIWEEGMFIMGIGRSHTPKAFVKACDIFTFTEILHPPNQAMKNERYGAPHDPTSTQVAVTLASHISSQSSSSTTSSATTFAAATVATPASCKRKSSSTSPPVAPSPISTLKDTGALKDVDMKELDRIFQQVVNEDTGRAHLGRFKELLVANDPTFDQRNYGFDSFRQFCESLEPSYELLRDEDGKTLYLCENEYWHKRRTKPK